MASLDSQDSNVGGVRIKTETTYVCEVCQVSFEWQDELALHYSSSHCLVSDNNNTEDIKDDKSVIRSMNFTSVSNSLQGAPSASRSNVPSVKKDNITIPLSQNFQGIGVGSSSATYLKTQDYILPVDPPDININERSTPILNKGLAVKNNQSIPRIQIPSTSTASVSNVVVLAKAAQPIRNRFILPKVAKTNVAPWAPVLISAPSSLVTAPGIPIQPKPSSSEPFADPLDDLHKYLYNCDRCGKGFKKKHSYKQHISKHNKNTDVQCKHCKKWFIEESHLSTHIFLRHKDKRPTCDKCGAQFSTEANLTKHFLESHTGKKFTCEQCGKMFAKEYELSRHTVARHSRTSQESQNLISAVCDRCGKVLKSKNSLYSHLRTHSKVDKSHVCDQCGEAFKTMRDLRLHSFDHDNPDQRPKVCKVCGRGFISQERFSEHLLTHEQEDNKEQISSSDAEGGEYIIPDETVTE